MNVLFNDIMQYNKLILYTNTRHMPGVRQFCKSVADNGTLVERFLCWSCDQHKKDANSMFKIVSV